MTRFFQRKKEKINDYISREEKITNALYENNLYFYTILKNLIQVGMSDNQLIKFQSMVNANKDKYGNNSFDFANFLLTTGSIITPNVKKYEVYEKMINLIDNNKFEEWLLMIDVSIDLMLFKDLILAEAKAYMNEREKDNENKINDKLSLEYDMNNLCMPYGQKVISSLLVYALTNVERKSQFIMPISNKPVKEINNKLLALVQKYSINCNNMFMLIVDESVSQSIKSSAGGDYESRVQFSIADKVDSLKTHSHDSNITAMEYDFTFELNGKKAGISAKRTLRERYKQNHEDIDVLDVDYVFLFTLGTDLNKDKLNHILQKKGLFVVVARELYEARDFLKNNPKVISSSNLTREKLLELMK